MADSVGNINSALPPFKNAFEANPKIAQFWFSYIGCLIKLKKFDDAKRVTINAKRAEISKKGLINLEKELQSNLLLDGQMPESSSNDFSERHQGDIKITLTLSLECINSGARSCE